jgi:hypothetical protein
MLNETVSNENDTLGWSGIKKGGIVENLTGS